MRSNRQQRMGRAISLLESDDAAPELSLLNLVDLMLVFAVGLLLAIVSFHGLPQAIAPTAVSATTLQQPGRPDIEVIVKKAQSIERMRLTDESLKGEGLRIGIAYRLASGEIVYVPETNEQAATSAGQTAPPRSP